MVTTKERVTHTLDPTAASHIPLFLPRVCVTRAGGGIGVGDDGDEDGEHEDVRPLNAGDLDRIMDYPNMPDPPPDCLVMHGVEGDAETDDADDDGGIAFPKRAAKLLGGYIFLSRPAAPGAAGGAAAGDGGGKLACIPLQGCQVDIPIGGRRVFREHAHTGARKGYELAIRARHGDDKQGAKLPCWIVLDSLGQREAWATAIRLRHDVGNKPTVLRPGGLAAARLDEAYHDGDGTGPPSALTARRPTQKHKWGTHKTARGASGAAAGGPTSSGNADLDAAVDQFGGAGFKEEEWVNDFLRRHSVDRLPGECDRLEKWMDVIKNGLRGAVLEQYEYFVEASREMSTMGREVAWIRTLVERQQESLMSMRNIDFGVGTGFDEAEEGAGDEEYGYLSADDGLLNEAGPESESSSSDEESSGTTPMRANVRQRRREKPGSAPVASLDAAFASPPPDGGTSSHIAIPPWISDATEEVSAFIKESRYSDATELILKARTEVSDILAAHNQSPPPVVTTPTPSRNTGNADPIVPATPGANAGTKKKLHKKQQAFLQRTNTQLDALMERMAKRLAENLRRKNEALRASAKRERADPLSNLAPLVSPVCLNDDAVALHLLVRLGRYQEAATAYVARRSLLLSECLHERPISSPVGMDAVIYAAQISSSFFSSLATAVEGFLDLFIDPNTDNGGNDDDTSLNSRSLTLGGGQRRIPAGALSAVVLWCDSELAKFTNVFGSSRLLGSLALSPPGIRRQEHKEGGRVSLAKEREHSIEVAAKCVNQAFAFAAENLDSIGLPLTPKLAENLRPKLKGCEAEVATLLDSCWKALAYDFWLPQPPPQPFPDNRRV